MIANTNAAEQTSELLIDVIRELLESLQIVQRSCTIEDIVAYRKASIQVLLKISERLLAPLAAMHPVKSLDPPKPFTRQPMVTDVETAKRVSEIMFEISKRLSESVDVVRSVAPPEEVKAYALGIGHVLTDIMYEVLNPVFARNPSIEPKEWK